VPVGSFALLGRRAGENPGVRRVLLPVLAAAGVAAELSAWSAGVSAAAGALDLAAGLCLAVAAAFARELRGWRVAGTGAGAALWFAGTLEAGSGTIGDVGAALASLYLVPLVSVLLVSPGERLPSVRDRALLLWLLVRGAVPALASSGGLTLATGAAISGTALAAQRGDRVGGWQRAACAALGAALVLASALRAGGASPGTGTTAVALAVAGCGLALVAGRGSGRLAPDRLVVDLGRTRGAQPLERRLASALRDPELRLLYRLRASDAWLDARGVQVGAPQSEAGRVVTRVEGEADGSCAALVHAEQVLEDAGLRAVVLDAVRLALVRLRVATDAAAQADALAASRRRLVATAAVERERLAEDVRQSTEPSFDTAAAALADAARRAPPELRAVLATTAAELDRARSDLHAAVRGEVGAVLRSRGLAGALAELAAGAGAVADIRLEDLNGGPQVAETAWYCVSEALANALKHAGGAPLAVRAVLEDGHLIVEVRDDGPGGADPAGSGLAGLRRRAVAAGGVLEIHSAPAAGTRVRLSLPCEAEPS
jgi:signal transduction histidine kinase